MIMTTSKYIKSESRGALTLKRMSDMTGVSARVLDDWYNNPRMRDRFEKILVICIEYEKKKNIHLS